MNKDLLELVIGGMVNETGATYYDYTDFCEGYGFTKDEFIQVIQFIDEKFKTSIYETYFIGEQVEDQGPIIPDYWSDENE